MTTLLRRAALAGVSALALAASPAQAEGPEIYVGVEGALLQFSGDGLQGGEGGEGGEGDGGGSAIGPLNLSSNNGTPIKPEDGWGGRVWIDIPLPIHRTPNSYTMLRGSANGDWLDDDDREDFGSQSFSEEIKQEAELDALWATLEVFNIWLFGPLRARHTRLGLGGGLEIADVENTFQENFTVFQNGNPIFAQQVRQELIFWGIGPRVSGSLDHELGQTGLHIFGELALACLFGDRDTEFDQDINGSRFNDNDGDGSTVLHTNLRVGVGYDLNLGGVNARIDAGWRHDRFSDATNTQFLPGNDDGNTIFSGPFVAVGFAVPLN